MSFVRAFDVRHALTCKLKIAAVSIVWSLFLLTGCGGNGGPGGVGSNSQTGQVRQLNEGLTPATALQRAPSPDRIAGGITEDLRPPTVN